jgi:hypothetical protein
MRKDVGVLTEVSLPTVDRWVAPYARFGLAGLEEHKRGGGRGTGPGSRASQNPGADPHDPTGRDGAVALVEPGDGPLRLAH